MSDVVVDKPHTGGADTRTAVRAEPLESPPPPQPGFSTGRRVAAALSFRRLSAIYIFVFLFILFSIWVPDTFLTASTWRSLLDNQALTALTAVGLTIPIAAGAFDLAIGAEVGLTSIFVSWMLVNHGAPLVVAVPLTLVVGAVVGGASALLVSIVKIDSFIATLGVSSVALACTQWLSGGAQILNLPRGFSDFSTHRLFGITVPVFILIAVSMTLWYVLENTPLGRRVYATGGNEQAARLAGIRTRLVVASSFVVCGVIAAGVGLLLASRLGTGDPTAGPSFLLPAFSAVFLGSTQFRAGRFNIWGTVVAVYVLAVGVKGLQLAGAPVWIPDLFNGLALLLAVGLAKYESTRRPFAAVNRLIGSLRGRTAKGLT